MIETKTFGNFYFKLTDAGNLIGEYLNDEIFDVRPESAWRQPQTTKKCFEGKYLSTWYEPKPSECVTAELVITRESNAVDVFKLVWQHSGKPIFQGRAMLCDGVLIGNYQSAKIMPSSSSE